MHVIHTKPFKKQFKRLDHYKQDRVRQALRLFQENPDHMRLRIHKLQGNMSETYSMSADHDLRIIFAYEGKRLVAILLAVGKHEEVY